MKYAQPKAWMKPGAKVLYHSIIGQPSDGKIREIEGPPWKLGHGQFVISVTGIAGGVALEALTEVK